MALLIVYLVYLAIVSNPTTSQFAASLPSQPLLKQELDEIIRV
jgi:hypothetical protein